MSETSPGVTQDTWDLWRRRWRLLGWHKILLIQKLIDKTLMGGEIHLLMSPLGTEWFPSSFPSQQLRELRAQFKVFSLHFSFRVRIMSHYTHFSPLSTTEQTAQAVSAADILKEPELRHHSRQTPASTLSSISWSSKPSSNYSLVLVDPQQCYICESLAYSKCWRMWFKLTLFYCG